MCLTVVMHIPCRNCCDCLLFGKSYPKQNIISSDPTKEVVSKVNENVAPIPTLFELPILRCLPDKVLFHDEISMRILRMTLAIYLSIP